MQASKLRAPAFTVLSAPDDAIRFSGCPGALADTSEPGGAAGDQVTAVAPRG